MKPAISQVCSLNAPFEQDLRDYASAACGAIEIWLTKLETYLQSHSIDDVRQLVAECRVDTPVASFQGGLLTSQGEFRKASWEHFQRRLEICQELGIGTLVVAGDMNESLARQDVERAQVSLAEAADQAQHYGVNIALEFQAQAKFCNNLQTAAALINECDRDNLGLCVDLFHYYTGPSKLEDFGQVPPGKLFHVQICDLSGVLRETATDAHRILPGDGDLLLEPIIEHLKRIPYDGYVSLELMNPTIWQVPPQQTGEVGMTSLRSILGQAEM